MSGAGRSFAVVGGGFAGCAVAWHLLAAAQAHAPIRVTLFDGAGLGGGASGAAAGLLHPFTPRGRVRGARMLEASAVGHAPDLDPGAQLLWRGDEAVADALELVAVSEAAAARAAANAGAGKGGKRQGFVWRQPLMRPAGNAQQAGEFAESTGRATASGFHVSPMAAAAVSALAPGFCSDALAAAAAGGGAGAALLVQGGLVVHPERYLWALWEACRQRAADAGGGSAAQLVTERIASLSELEARHGPFDAIVVAAGAAVGALPELYGLLPLELCQGFTLELAAPPPGAAPALPATAPNVSAANRSETCPHTATGQQRLAGAPPPATAAGVVPKRNAQPGAEEQMFWPAGAPSLLGEVYVAAQGRAAAVVGATRRYGLSPDAALAECGRAVDARSADAAAAAAALHASAAALWAPAGSWQVAALRSGVRAMPPRTQDGKVPLAGRVPEQWLRARMGPPPAAIGSDAAGAASPPAPGASSAWGAPGHVRGAAGSPILAEAVGAAAKEGGRGVRMVEDPDPDPVLKPKGHGRRRWWVVAGLGARGLVYHAWLGRAAAAAVLADDEALLPAELRAWQKRLEAAAPLVQRRSSSGKRNQQL